MNLGTGITRNLNRARLNLPVEELARDIVRACCVGVTLTRGAKDFMVDFELYLVNKRLS